MVMNKTFLIVLSSAILLVSGCDPEPVPIDPVAAALRLPSETYHYSMPSTPAHFNAPNVTARDNTPFLNPVTDDGATLGRVLFYERAFSQNKTLSCASCHHQLFGFGDTARLSHGFSGGLTGRNSMGLTNARFYANGAFFWDERAATLEQQVLMPMQDPIEMGMTLDSIVARAQKKAYYPPLFEKAFGSTEITSTKISLALAQFIRSMMSYESRYDAGRAQVANPGINFPNFTAQENQGKALFFGVNPAGGGPVPGACVGCHGTEAFTSPGPRNNGLDLTTTDPGVGGANGNPGQVGLFKSSSLRNIAQGAPFMHDGRFSTLEQVVNHYSNGVKNHPNLSPELKGPNGLPIVPNFTAAQKTALVAFLHTLTDVSFQNNEAFEDPFIR